ncbi:MAG: LacI family DNA-binding transcriptional regulator [Oscillospiraceae bacterium]|nr:LacI family DNA-binding transcriptional regulator [Oscillospiraceae bacterium]
MMTLTKLAKLANVSASTASKAFSGSPEVNEETREMIFAIAKKNGCFKKFYNVKYPKLVVAIIAPEFKSTYYTRYLSYMQELLEKENCEICVSATDFSEEKEKALLEYYYKHSNVDGIIIVNARTDIAERYEIPVVYVVPKSRPTCGVSILSKTKPAFLKSIAYLAEKNVDSVGFIGEKLTSKKFEMFQQCLQENGIPFHEAYVSISDGRFEAGGYSAMEKLLAEKRLPRAVVCAYDRLAIGAIRCVYDYGLSVPEDIAVLGMDDIPEAKFLNPPLASVSANTETLCRMATEAVFKQMNGEEVSKLQTVESEFYLRRSFEID